MIIKYFIFFIVYVINNCFCSVTFERDPKSEPSEQKPEPKVDYTFHMLQLFDQLDLDSDGVLSKSELETHSKKLSKLLSDRQLANEMDTIDRDKDGHISLEELLAAFSSEVGEEDATRSQDLLLKRFNIADRNKDGKLSLSELGDLVNPSRNPELLKLELDDVLRVHDKDGDDRISYDEYRKYRHDDGEDESQSANDFKQLDKDGDGFLTRHELELVFKEEEEFDNFTMYDDVTNIVGSTDLTRQVWEKHANELAKSSVTDFQELLEHPTDYGFKFEPAPKTVSVEELSPDEPEVHVEL